MKFDFRFWRRKTQSSVKSSMLDKIINHKVDDDESHARFATCMIAGLAIVTLSWLAMYTTYDWAIIVILALTYAVAYWRNFHQRTVFWVLVGVTIWDSLIQLPTGMIGMPVLALVGSAFLQHRLINGTWSLPFADRLGWHRSSGAVRTNLEQDRPRSIGRRLVAKAAKIVALSIIPVALAGLTAFVYNWMYRHGIPHVQPVAVWFWEESPLLVVLAFMLIIPIAAARSEKASSRSHALVYRLVPIAYAIGFCVVYPQYLPQEGAWYSGFNVFTAIQGAILAFYVFAGLAGTIQLLVCGCWLISSVFIIFFVGNQLSSTSQMLMIANATPTEYVDKLPSTVINRIKPLFIGEIDCGHGNGISNTEKGPVSIAASDDGKRFEFQCHLRYNRFTGDDVLLSWLGGVRYVVRVDAGTNGNDNEIVDVYFAFPDDDPVVGSSVTARFLGGQTGEFTYTAGTKGGGLKLVIPVVRGRLHGFAMVPSVVGAVVEHQPGVFVNYSLSAAAKEFPSVFLLPSSLGKLRTKAFNEYRSLGNLLWTRDYKQESESNNACGSTTADTAKAKTDSAGNLGHNSLPYGVMTKSGPVWWTLVKPLGNGGTAASEILFFDRYGALKVLNVQNRNVIGLSTLVSSATKVIHSNVGGIYGCEGQIVITDKGGIFFAVPLLQDVKGQPEPIFNGVAVLDHAGQDIAGGVVDTAEKVEAAIKAYEDH